MPVFDEPSRPDDQPEPSVELALFRVFVEAHVSLMSREEAVTYLRRCAEIMAAREEMANIVPIRKADRAKMEAALAVNRKAAAAFRRVLEGCISRIQAPPPLTKDDE